MALYRPLSDNLYELDSSAGPIPVSASEDQLKAYGHTLDPGALALNDNGGGQGNVPATASDAMPNYTPAGQGGAPAQPVDQDLIEGAPNSPSMMPKSEAMANVTRATNPIADTTSTKTEGTDKFAPKTESLDLKSYLAAAHGPYVPAKDQRAAFTLRKGKSVPQDLLDADSDAAIDKRLAMQTQGDLEADRAEKVGAAADNAIGAQEKAVSADEIKVQKWRQEYARRQDVIDKERAANDDLKVDPDQVFSDHGGTWARILAGISVIAGGLAQGVGRLAKNPGLEAVNNAIDRNIDLQREQIANKKAGTKGKENELERLTKVYGNPEIAEQELRNRQMSLFSAYAKRAMMQAPEDVRANVQSNMADFEQQRVAQRVAVDQAAQDDVTEQWVNRPAHYAGGAGASTGQIPRGLLQSANAADSVTKLGKKLLDDYGVKEGQDVSRTEGWGIGIKRDLFGKTARDIESNLEPMFAEHYKMLTGNGPTEADKKEFQERASSWSTAQKINFVNNALQQAHHKQKFIDGQRGKNGAPLTNDAAEPASESDE